MVTEEEKIIIIQTLVNAKITYELILTKVNQVSKSIDIMDEAIVKPLKNQNKFFALTLIAGGLPLDMVELQKRLEFIIGHLDKYIADFKGMKAT